MCSDGTTNHPIDRGVLSSPTWQAEEIGSPEHYRVFYQNPRLTGQWWHRTIIPALGRQRQADFFVSMRPLGIQSEFQDSDDYAEKLF